MLTEDYFHSILDLQNFCREEQIGLNIQTLGQESLVTRARNTLVANFLDNDSFTHLLFIDADIAFNPDSVLRMLDFNEDVVAGVYPRKAIDWAKVKKKLKEKPDMPEDALLATAIQYNLNVKNPNRIEVKKGFIEVMDAATGFMLIKRNVFKQMAENYPDLQFKPDQHINQSHETEFDYHKTSNWNYTFFDTMVEPETRRYLSEDYAFCRLWQKIGGKIYADILSGMTHYGNYAFKGNVGTQFLPQNNK